MKKSTITLFAVAAGLSSLLFAKEVRDWRDIHSVHENIKHAINEMERARSANNYDMQGHGAKAEQYLRQAEQELELAVKAMRQ